MAEQKKKGDRFSDRNALQEIARKNKTIKKESNEHTLYYYNKPQTKMEIEGQRTDVCGATRASTIVVVSENLPELQAFGKPTKTRMSPTTVGTASWRCETSCP